MSNDDTQNQAAPARDAQPAEPVLVPTPRRTIKKPVVTLGMKPQKAGDRFTLLERKLYFALMFFAQKQGWEPNQSYFTAPLADVLEKVGYNSKNLTPVRDAIKAMTGTAVDWQSPSEHEGCGPEWTASSLMAEAKIKSLRSGSEIAWAYGPSMREQILKPTLYSSATLEVQQVLSTYSALTLFDICVRYVDTPKHAQTPARPWEWWRPVLTGGADGLEAKPEFKIFNRDVLKKAIAEVNLKTPIDVELVVQKSGKRVTNLQFLVSRKKNFTKPLAAVENEAGLKEIGRAIAAGISQTQAELFLEGHGTQELAQGLDQLENRQSKEGLPTIRKPEAYLKTLLQNHPLEATTGLLANVKNEAAVEKQKRLQLREQLLAKRLSEAVALYDESPAQDQESLRSRFELEVVSKLPASTQRMFATKGHQAAAIKSLFKTFLATHFYGSQWNMPSDDDLARFVIRQG